MTRRKFVGLMVLILIGGLALFKAAEAPVFSVADQDKKIPILMYHKISPFSFHGGLGLRVPPDRFEQQLKYLKRRGYHTVSLDQLSDHWDRGIPLPSRPVVLTLDDGYEDNYHWAFPLLKKYHYTATIFLVYNEIGGYNSWDAKDNPAKRVNLLSWPQIREMQKSGISFQAHTLTHPSLVNLTPDKAREEINQSRVRLQKALGGPVNFISYPYGRHNPTIDRMVREAGYRGAISTLHGKNDSNTNRYGLTRLRVNGYISMDEFKESLEK